jgi:DHA3 family macrolide efflux protein-like MFS transporter
MFLSGLIVPFFVAAITTLLQEKIDNNMQGRIFGLTQIVMAGVMPLGMVIVGPIADIVAIEILFVITGFLMALLGIKVFFNKSTQA